MMTVVSRRLIYKFLLDFVYPNRCPICGSFIKWDELLCKNCECKLPFHKKYCAKSAARISAWIMIHYILIAFILL